MTFPKLRAASVLGSLCAIFALATVSPANPPDCRHGVSDEHDNKRYLPAVDTNVISCASESYVDVDANGHVEWVTVPNGFIDDDDYFPSSCWWRLTGTLSGASPGLNFDGYASGLVQLSGADQGISVVWAPSGFAGNFNRLAEPSVGDFLPAGDTIGMASGCLVPTMDEDRPTGWQNMARPTLGGEIDLITGLPLVKVVDLELPLGGATFRLARTRSGMRESPWGIGGPRASIGIGAAQAEGRWWDWTGTGWMASENPYLLIDSAIADIDGDNTRTVRLVLDAHHSIPFQMIESVGEYEAPPRFRAQLKHNGNYDTTSAEWIDPPSQYDVYLYDGAIHYTFVAIYVDVPPNRWDDGYPSDGNANHAQAETSYHDNPYLPGIDSTPGDPWNHDPWDHLANPGFGIPHYGICTRIADRYGHAVEIEYCRVPRVTLNDPDTGPAPSSNCEECQQYCLAKGQIRKIVIKKGETPLWTLIYVHRMFRSTYGSAWSHDGFNFALHEPVEWIGDEYPHSDQNGDPIAANAAVYEAHGSIAIDRIYVYDHNDPGVNIPLDTAFDCRTDTGIALTIPHIDALAPSDDTGPLPAGWQYQVRYHYMPADADGTPMFPPTLRKTTVNRPDSDDADTDQDRQLTRVYHYENLSDVEGGGPGSAHKLAWLTHIFDGSDIGELNHAWNEGVFDDQNGNPPDPVDEDTLSYWGAPDPLGTDRPSYSSEEAAAIGAYASRWYQEADVLAWPNTGHPEMPKASAMINDQGVNGQYVTVDSAQLVHDSIGGTVAACTVPDGSGGERYYRVHRMAVLPSLVDDSGSLNGAPFHTGGMGSGITDPFRSVFFQPFHWFSHGGYDASSTWREDLSISELSNPRWIAVIDEFGSPEDRDGSSNYATDDLALKSGQISRRVVEINAAGYVLKERKWEFADGDVLRSGFGLGEEFIYDSVYDYFSGASFHGDVPASLSESLLLIERRSIGWSAADISQQHDSAQEGLIEFYEYKQAGLLAPAPAYSAKDDLPWSARVQLIAQGIKQGTGGTKLYTREILRDWDGAGSAQSVPRPHDVLAEVEYKVRTVDGGRLTLATIPAPDGTVDPPGGAKITRYRSVWSDRELDENDDPIETELDRELESRITIAAPRKIDPNSEWYYPVNLESYDEDGNQVWTGVGQLRDADDPSAHPTDTNQRLILTFRHWNARSQPQYIISDTEPGAALGDLHRHPSMPTALFTQSYPSGLPSDLLPTGWTSRIGVEAPLHYCTAYVFDRFTGLEDIYFPNKRRFARRIFEIYSAEFDEDITREYVIRDLVDDGGGGLVALTPGQVNDYTEPPLAVHMPWDSNKPQQLGGAQSYSPVRGGGDGYGVRTQTPPQRSDYEIQQHLISELTWSMDGEEPRRPTTRPAGRPREAEPGLEGINDMIQRASQLAEFLSLKGLLDRPKSPRGSPTIRREVEFTGVIDPTNIGEGSEPAYEEIAQAEVKPDSRGRLRKVEVLEPDELGNLVAVGTKVVNDLGEVYREQSVDGTITRVTRNAIGQEVRTYVGTDDTRWTDSQSVTDNMALISRIEYGDGVNNAWLPTVQRTYRAEPNSPWAADYFEEPTTDSEGRATVTSYDWRMRSVKVERFPYGDPTTAIPESTRLVYLDYMSRPRFVVEIGSGTVSYTAQAPDPVNLDENDPLPSATDLFDITPRPLSIVETIYAPDGTAVETRDHDIDWTPGVGSPPYLAEYTYTGQGGATVFSQSPSSPRMVRELDALGREISVVELRPNEPGTTDYELSRTDSVYDPDGNIIETILLTRTDFSPGSGDQLDHSDGVNTGNAVRTRKFFWYDARNRVIATAELGTENTTDDTYSNDAIGIARPSAAPTWNGTSIVDSSGLLGDSRIRITQYDDNGKVSLEVMPDSTTTEFVYDKAGRIEKKIENSSDIAANRRTTEYEYDLGRLVSVKSSRASPSGVDDDETLVTYGADILEVVTVESPPGTFTESYSYVVADTSRNNGLIGKLQQSGPLTDASLQDPPLFTFRYDRQGRLAERIDARGAVMRYFYDDLGRISRVYVGYYDAMGVFQDGYPTSMDTYIGSPVDRIGYVQYSYDSRQRLTDVIARESETGPIIAHNKFTYDDRDRLTHDRQSIGALVDVFSTPYTGYSWDYEPTDLATSGPGHHRPTVIDYPVHPSMLGRTVTLGYGAVANDDDDLLSRITDIDTNYGPAQVADFAYFGTGLRRSMSLGNGEIDQDWDTDPVGDGFEGRDRFGQVKDLHYKNDAATTLFRAQHTYDVMGNRMSSRVTQAPFNLQSRDNVRSSLWGYDDLQRLVSAEVGALNTANDDITTTERLDTWGLDLLGNWAEGTGRASSGNLDGFGHPWQLPGADLASDSATLDHTITDQNEITAIDIVDDSGTSNFTPEYDAVGNLLFDGEYYYQYDAWNRLLQVNRAAGLGSILETVKNHTYDGQGRLIRTQSPYPDPDTTTGEVRSERFYYDGVRRIQELIVDPVVSVGSGMASQEPGMQQLLQETVESPESLDGSASTSAFETGQMGLGAGAPTTFISREYIWGSGDNGIDELLVQYDENGDDWWALLDASGDVVALCDLEGVGGDARVVAQWSYDPYGNPIAREQIHPFAELHLGHKGLFVDRLDVGIVTSAGGPESVRVTPYARLVYHNRNRAYAPHLGRFLQKDPNATAVVLLSAPVYHGDQVGAIVAAFDLLPWYADGANLYLYNRSNPGRYEDPMGLLVFGSLGEFSVANALGGAFDAAVPGAIFGAASAGMPYIMNGQVPPAQALLWGAIGGALSGGAGGAMSGFAHAGTLTFMTGGGIGGALGGGLEGYFGHGHTGGQLLSDIGAGAVGGAAGARYGLGGEGYDWVWGLIWFDTMLWKEALRRAGAIP